MTSTDNTSLQTNKSFRALESFSTNSGKNFHDNSDWNKALVLWDKYTSPFRSSPEEIKNYSIVINQVKDGANALLLGATPEIREILSASNFNIVIADFSFDMIYGMLFLDYNITASKENWVKANWVDLDQLLKNEHFDIILGDLVLRNILPSLQSKFLKTIWNVLANNGIFITRIHICNNHYINKNPNEIIQEALIECKNSDTKFIEDLITSRLFDKNTDKKLKRINKEAFASDIDKYIREVARNKREKLILNNIYTKWARGQRTWTQRTSKEIDQLLLKHFIIREKIVATDYKDSEFYPIYILRKHNYNKNK